MLEDGPSEDPNLEKRRNPRVDLFQEITEEEAEWMLNT